MTEKVDKQKIALVISTIHDIPNKAVYQRSRLLAENFDLHILTKSPVPRQISALSSKTSVITGRQYFGLGSVLFPVLVCLKIILDPSIKHVYTVFSHSIPNLLIGYFCHFFGKTWIADILDDPWLPVSKAEGGIGRALHLGLYRLLRRVLGKADLVIALRGLGVALQHSGFPVSDQKLFETTNGVDSHGTAQKKDLLAVDTDLHEEFAVLYVGIIKIERGVEDLIKSAALLKNRIGHFRVWLVGWLLVDADVQYLQKLVIELGLEDIIIFTGELDHDAVLRYIYQSDVCVYPFPNLPHLNHVSPIKVFEYMACGKPVVATNLAGIDGVVEPGITGVIIPPSDPGAMAAALFDLYANPERTQLMGRNALVKVREFDWNTINSKLLDRLNAALSHQSG